MAENNRKIFPNTIKKGYVSKEKSMIKFAKASCNSS